MGQAQEAAEGWAVGKAIMGKRVLAGSPAEQEAWWPLVAWDLALLPHCGHRQVTQAGLEAGPRALLSHCCAPSSAGRIHKTSSESLLSHLLGVWRPPQPKSRRPGSERKGKGEDTHSHRDGFSQPVLFHKPKWQGPAAPISPRGLSSGRAGSARPRGPLPSLHGRTVPRTVSAKVRMLNTRWTGPLPAPILTPSGPGLPNVPIHKGKNRN